MDRFQPDACSSERWRRLADVLLAMGCGAVLALSGAGCQMLSSSWEKARTIELPGRLQGDDGGAGGVDAAEVEAMAFGTWTKDSIHCAEDHCRNIYGVIVDEPGTIKAEVFAPLGVDVPDFDLALLDAEGNPIAHPVDPDRRPRRLEHRVEPGNYFLLVSSRGDNEARLKYELLAKISTKRRSPSVPAKPPAAEPEPVPTTEVASTDTLPTSEQPSVSTPAPRREVLVTAEVLDIEEDADDEMFVLLDKGTPHLVTEQMQGELMDGDRPIGQIVVVEVYADGSRARVEGSLDGEVGIDTVADLFR